MEVKVLFFGVLAEISGTMERNYGGVKSVDDLQKKIANEFPKIENYDFRISVNSNIINEDALLNNGDEVALMPPFAGG